MNIFSPTLFNTHKDGSGIRPNVGCLERSHPNTSPAINAPPLVLRLIGIFPKCTTNEPITPPIKIPRPTKIISVWLVGRSAYPKVAAAAFTSILVPTSSSISPGLIFVAANTGILTPARLILLMLTPCITFSLRRPATVIPENFLREISTGNVSAGKSSNSRSFTSSPIQSSSPITNSRRPLNTTSFPF